VHGTDRTSSPWRDHREREVFVLLSRLREATRDAHVRLERVAPLLQAPLTEERYRDHLRALLGFSAPLEPRLLAFPEAAELEVTSRCRSHLAAQDLEALGEDPSAAPRCTALPDVGTWPRALGVLYVLEGSTLGGQHLVRRVQAELGLQRGTSYLQGYGSRTGAMWSRFRDRAEAYCAACGGESEVIASACATFDALERWLGPAGSAARLRDPQSSRA
jgi:heme oxygenase